MLHLGSSIAVHSFDGRQWGNIIPGNVSPQVSSVLPNLKAPAILGLRGISPLFPWVAGAVLLPTYHGTVASVLARKTIAR